MEPSSFFSGLLSGVDFRGLVDAIIQAEARPIDAIDRQIARIEARSTVFVSYEGLLTGLRDASQKLGDTSVFSGRTVTGGGSIVGASADPGAQLGSHSVRVLQTAQAERLGGGVFGAGDQALGLSGEFFLGGQRVAVAASDTLADVAASINQANTGSSASGVSASLISVGANDHRLVLATDQTGAQGINLVDGSSGLLKSLGFLDQTVALKHATSDGARSDAFANGTQAIGTLRGMQSGPGPQTVDIGGVSVTLDLDTMSLSDIASEINTQAAGAGSSISAQVVTEGTGSGQRYRLDVSGTTSFTDAGGVLELIGVLEGGRSDVAHQLQSANVLQAADGSTPASGSTALALLNVNGSAAGVQVGDTIDISGTRGDGSVYQFTYTVGVGDTVQDILDRLNDGTDGLQAGTRTATASIDASGRLVVTDDATGDSRLSLSLVANNEGGGTLDFGSQDDAVVGRNRTIASGRDAQFEVDGVFLQRSSNSVSDAVSGLTLDLLGSDPNQTTTITVGRDTQSTVDAITEFVEAYNAAATFASEQVASPAAGEERGPLAGDTTMRGMAAQLRDAMRASLPAGIAGNLVRMLDIGIELQQDGTFELDVGTLTDALETDPTAVERLFGLYGQGSVSELGYVAASDATVAGTYAVDITQAATRAIVTGAGFLGTYVDDGNADSISIKDVGSGATYTVALNNGDTLQDIVDRINAEFGTQLQEIHQSAEALKSDALGTAASEATLLQNIHSALGINAGVATGDTLSVTGTQRGGASFSYDFVVGDPANQTLGDVLDAVRAQVGTDTDITLDATGALVATDRSTGSSLFTLDISSDNAGGGSLSFGAIAATQEGRAEANLTAASSGGQLEISATEYGSANGVELSFAGGGVDGTVQLGLSAGSTTGLDVVGTIGGFAATGSGQLLTGDPGSDVEGLSLTYAGAGTGGVGSMTFSRGLGSQVQQAAEALIDSGPGSIDAVVEQATARVTSLEGRIDVLTARLDRREALLLSRFVAAESAMAQFQVQYTGLFSALGLPGAASGNNNGNR